MDIYSILHLLDNAALLIAMVLVCDFALSSFKNTRSLGFQIISGLSLGIICAVLMFHPLQLMPGLIIDTRSILLGLAGLFFPYLASGIAMLIAVLVRLEIGGIGALTGILVIMSSTFLGILFRKYKSKPLQELTWYQFYAFSVVVNGVFLLLLLYTIPGPTALTALSDVGIPVLLIYPAVMTLLAMLMANRLDLVLSVQESRKSKSLLDVAMSSGRLSFFEIDLPTGEVLTDFGMTQLSGEETAGRKLLVNEWLDTVYPEDRKRMRALHDDIVKGAVSEFRTDYRQQTRDGRLIWILAEGRVSERDYDGEAMRIIGTNIDITGQKESEYRMHVFNALLDQSLDAIEVLDPETGRFLDCNAAAYKNLGYTREEFLKLHVFDIDAELGEDTFKKNVQKLRKEGALSWESTHVHKDGSTVPVEISLKFARLDKDYLISIVRETSERLKTRKIMREDAMRHRLLIEESRDGIVIVDGDGAVYEANRKFLDMLGYEPEEMQKLHIWDWDFQCSKDQLLAMLYDVDESGDHFETRHRRKDGSVFDVEISTNGSSIGGEKYVFCVCRDITDRKKTEEEISLASLVYKNSHEGMMITDMAGRIVNVNEAFCKITGYTPDEVIGENPRLLQSGIHDEEFYQNLWQALHDQGFWEGEIWNKKKNGDVYPQRLSIHAAYTEEKQISHWVAQFTDLTERKKSEELLWKRTNYDMLTGLPNRLMLNRILGQELKKCKANNSKLAFMLLDIDGFKNINEALGHEVGDVLLKEVAFRLQDLFRQSDMVARTSGDEFAIIMPDLNDLEIVNRRAGNMLKRLAVPFTLKNQVVYITASIGVTFYPSDAETVGDLHKNAEEAMEAAKSKGRNHFELHTPDLHKYVASRLSLSVDLRRALEEQTLSVAYQPIVDLVTGEIKKAEALARWRHPVKGNIPPTEFIALAEDIGVITELDDYVFSNATDFLKELLPIAPEFRISVNKSAVDFQNVKKTGKDNWVEILSDNNIPGENIVVELTESLLLDASFIVNELLSEYRAAGMKIAQDDFGTGYSSLSYLRKFHIDIVKIDQSFVHNLAPGSEDLLLCEAIISMAHKLGIEVIAEGVEKEEHRSLLAHHGCEYGQGYLFSKPVSSNELKNMLEKSHA